MCLANPGHVLVPQGCPLGTQALWPEPLSLVLSLIHGDQVTSLASGGSRGLCHMASYHSPGFDLLQPLGPTRNTELGCFKIEIHIQKHFEWTFQQIDEFIFLS